MKLEHWVLQSAGWRSLTCAARAVFIEACAFYNGSNNGTIILPTREIASRCGISKSTASRVIRELENAGFLECTYLGSFLRQNRKASEYRITLFKCDVSGHKASKRFMQTTAYETKRKRLSNAGDQTGANKGQAKDSFTPGAQTRDRKGEIASSVGPSNGTQIVYQGGAGDTQNTVRSNVVPFAIVGKGSSGGNKPLLDDCVSKEARSYE